MLTPLLRSSIARYALSGQPSKIDGAAYKIQETVRTEGLTDHEKEQLIEAAIADGRFDKANRDNQAKVNAYVAQHWREYLQL